RYIIVSNVGLGRRGNAIPRRSYLFAVSWPDIRRTLLVAIEPYGDPYGVIIPTAEIIRFYYVRPRRTWHKHSFGENTVKRSTPSGVASPKKAWLHDRSSGAERVERRIRGRLARVPIVRLHLAPSQLLNRRTE